MLFRCRRGDAAGVVDDQRPRPARADIESKDVVRRALPPKPFAEAKEAGRCLDPSEPGDPGVDGVRRCMESAHC